MFEKSRLSMLIGSISIGIVAVSLFIMGYFPNILYMLGISVVSAYIMLVCITVLGLAKKIVHMHDFVVGFLGVVSASGLTMSSVIENTSRSAMLLVFLSAVFFAYMCGWFFKIVVYDMQR